MEFFTGLIVGLIVGWLLNWAIQPLVAQLGKGRTGSLVGLGDTLADIEVRLRAVENASAGESPRILTVSGESRVARVMVTDRDPLEEIRGIGPVFAERLNEAGVYTFEELADLTPPEIQEIIGAERWQELAPADWIREAASLARLPAAQTDGRS